MGKLVNITGQRFGFWVVQKQGDNNKSGKSQWLCLCECGTLKLISSNSLRTGNSTSCGCNHTPNLANKKCGDLTVLKLDDSKSKNRRYWICQCKCGKQITFNTNQLNNSSYVCEHENYRSNLISNNIIISDKIIDDKSLECFVKIVVPYDKIVELISKYR